MMLRSLLYLLLLVGLCGAATPRAFAQAEAHWPTVVKSGEATATIYEPQPTAWPGRTEVFATAAIIIAKPGKPNIVGTMDISAQTMVDMQDRWVTFSHVDILATHFPMLDTAQAAELQDKIGAFAAQMTARKIPLDTLLLALGQKPLDTTPVKTDNTPPAIFHSISPAILVVTDGPPVMTPLKGTDLSFAVNTNWSLFKQGATGTWYLLDGAAWLSAPAFNGPYQPAGVLPADFASLPDDKSFADVRKYVPNGPAPATPPSVYVSTSPAQIIVTQGQARLTAIPGTPLQYVSNTEAEVIFDPAGKLYYVLFSGRWFSAPGLNGPWTYATPHLPPSFALIPADGPQGAVLASIPGTAQAQAAVITAQIPVQTSLPKTTTTTVTYAGAPQFAPIPGTTMSYAVNTSAQIILVNGRYYNCYAGAWYVSSSPTGPWVLATAVPAVIYTIPPSSPLYPVTYVRIYTVTPTAVVVGYTAGYTMGMICASGVVVYGTGFYYPPVVIPGVVPIYYPYPYTYAGGVRYVSATGGWATGGAVYGPYGGVAARSYYNPATGAYAHGSAVWGPYGGAAYGSFSNPATGRYGSTTQSWSPYGRSGASTVTGPNGTVHTQSASTYHGTAGGFSASNGAEGAAAHNNVTGSNSAAVKTSSGDVYAGHNGNVYEHTDSGWSKYSGGSFQPVSPSASGTYNQLNQDRAARQGGWQQQNSFRQSSGYGGHRR